MKYWRRFEVGSFSVLGATIKDLGQHSSACLFSCCCCCLPVWSLVTTQELFSIPNRCRDGRENPPTCDVELHSAVRLLCVKRPQWVTVWLLNSSMSHCPVTETNLCFCALWLFYRISMIVFLHVQFSFCFFFFLQKHVVEISLKTEE